MTRRRPGPDQGSDPRTSERGPSAIDYRSLVQDERVHGSIYTDPDVFADEMARIYGRGWVFVAHESEIPNPRNNPQIDDGDGSFSPAPASAK